jgi:hypothetical protein
MGDRGNIIMEYDRVQGEAPTRVFLYTHWSGYRLPSILQTGLIQGRGRWSDDAYLARILFCTMVGENWSDTTGYGIAPWVPDNEYDFLLVQVCQQKVLRVDLEWHCSQDAPISDYIRQSWTFEEYIEIPMNEGWTELDNAANAAVDPDDTGI